MAQSADVSIKPNGEKVTVEVHHQAPATAEGFVEQGMVSKPEDVSALAVQQWRIKAQRAARDAMEKAWENGVRDEESLAEVAQDAFDTYVYGGRRASSINVIRAAEMVEDPENPSEQEVSILERLDAQDDNKVIWAGVSR